MSSGNSILSSLIKKYGSHDAEKPQKKDAGLSKSLGTDEFLTLLVAQLENQNPLDPADTEKFTDQLAQFTQVEQLINVNEKLNEVATNIEKSKNHIDANSFVGMTVKATVTAMTIDDGDVTAGFYKVEKPAEVMVYVYDSDGKKVATLPQGEAKAGSHLISWKGTDDKGKKLDDGEYSYVVMANYGDGYKEVESYLSGKVDAVSYQNGKEYLVVSGVLVDPDNVTMVSSSSSHSPNESTSILEYLGATVSSNYPIVYKKDGKVQGDALSFNLTAASDVTVTIYNAADEKVDTIKVAAKDTAAGKNSVAWDGLTSNGYASSDGLYYYTVKADNGVASTAVSGEVSAITSVGGKQYLEIGDTGRLVSVSSITSIKR